MPSLDLGPEPEHRPAAAEVNNRPGHLGVSRLILAHGVSVGQTEDLGNVVGVDQVIEKNASGHEIELTRVSGRASRP